MPWIFGARINRSTRRVVFPCSVDVAAARHATGESYAAVLCDEDGVSVAALEINPSKPFYDVYFYDDLGRVYLTYVFVGSDARTGLFLTETGFNQFGTDGSFEPARSERFRVIENSRKMILQITDIPAKLRQTREGTREAAELGLHLESTPVFGRYASLLRIDRDRTLDDQPPDSPSWLAAQEPPN